MSMLKELVQSEKGSSLVLVAIALTVLLGVSALAVDGGLLYLEQARLKAAADAAALAGAAALKDGVGAAYNTACAYAEDNGLEPGEYTVDVDASDDTVTVSATRQVSLALAKVLGKQDAVVKASSKARIGALAAVTGAAPLAVEQQEFHYGWLYTLKEGGGDGFGGNYGALALGLQGASNYYENLIHGYPSELRIGDYVVTEPGNMSGDTYKAITYLINSCNHVPSCTVDHYYPNCPRILKVVVVDSLDVSGRSKCQIVGFAAFLVEGVGGYGNECEIYGRFLQMIVPGESIAGAGYGLYSVRLVK